MLKFQKPTLFFWCVVLGMGGFNVLSQLNVNVILRTELILVIAGAGLISTFFEFRRRSRLSD